MKYIALLLIILWGCTSAKAQQLKKKGYHDFEVGETSYIVAPKANIRNQPSIESGKVTNVLLVGTEVQIIEKTEEDYTLDKVTANWYKIKFKGKEGYVWGGLIAVGWLKSEESPKQLFLYGLSSCYLNYAGLEHDRGYGSYYTGNLALRLCIDHKIVSEAIFRVEDINGKQHQLSFLAPDTIRFSANEFSHTEEEAVFKNDYIFSFQDEKIQFVGEKYHVGFRPEQNGLVPIEYPPYARFHKIKRYRVIRLWENKKRPYIPSGDYEERTIQVGKRKGYIVEHKKFDIQGNVIEDYQFLSEGPLIYKYDYRYLKYSRFSHRIDTIFDITGIEQKTVHNFKYRRDGQVLDSVEIYTAYKDDYSRKNDPSTVSIQQYQAESSPPKELVYLGDQLRIKRTDFSCYEYFYENNLLRKTIQFDESCQNAVWQTNYEYNSKGLLIGKQLFDAENKLSTEYVYLYDYYISDPLLDSN